MPHPGHDHLDMGVPGVEGLHETHQGAPAAVAVSPLEVGAAALVERGAQGIGVADQDAYVPARQLRAEGVRVEPSA